MRTKNRLPGVLAAVHRRGEVLWASGQGFADVERRVPVELTTVFRIASITKLFTATAVMLLDDAGELSIDHTVARYVPAFPEPSVTLRQLLCHASGLQRETPDDPGWATGRFLLGDAFRRAIPRAEFPFRPMERWKYSNLGYNILGEVISGASGQPYETFVDDRIIRPLGLSSTFFDPALIEPARIAAGYRRLLGPPAVERDRQDTWPVPAPAGQLFSSIDDVCRFAGFFMGDIPGPLDRDVLRSMRRPVFVVDGLGRGRAQGLGPIVISSNGGTLVGHAGGLFGYASWLLTAEHSHVGAVALTNVGDGIGLLQLCRDLIRDAEEVLPPLPSPVDDGPTEAIRPLLGRYWGDGGVLNIVWVDGGIVALWDGADPNESEVMDLTYLGGPRVRVENGPYSGEVALFHVTEEQRVVGFAISTYEFVRIA
jgi:CubicO group peptidase (beta-lactamase class C family)